MIDVRAELLAEYSKQNTMRIVKVVGPDKELFRQLIDIFFEGQKHINKMAAWAIPYCFEAYPFLIEPYLNRMVLHLKTRDLHAIFKRTTLKILEGIEIPENLYDDVFEICYEFLSDTKEPAAVRIQSMQVLYDISCKIPELQNELALIIEDHIPYGTPGFQNRGKHILQKIRH